MTKETIIKSTLKYLVKRQIEEGSVGFAVDNDTDHDCCWDDVLAWIEAQPSEDCISREEVQDLISRWLSDYLLDETREALETINYKVGDMPPVTPERPKEKWIDDLITKVLTEVDGGTDDLYIRYNDICERIEASIKEFFSEAMNGGEEDGAETR